MMYTRALSLLVSILLFATLAFADQPYRWEDENGRVVYGNRPPVNSKTELISTKISRYSSKRVLNAYERASHIRDATVEDIEQESSPANGPTLSVVEGSLQVAHDEQGRITSCTVAVSNTGQKAENNVQVFFVFDEENRIQASGPLRVAAGGSETYLIPEQFLPVVLTSLAEPTVTVPEEHQVAKEQEFDIGQFAFPIPKVEIES